MAQAQASAGGRKSAAVRRRVKRSAPRRVQLVLALRTGLPSTPKQKNRRDARVIPCVVPALSRPLVQRSGMLGLEQSGRLSRRVIMAMDTTDQS